jgi:hypothetical protein
MFICPFCELTADFGSSADEDARRNVYVKLDYNLRNTCGFMRIGIRYRFEAGRYGRLGVRHW